MPRRARRDGCGDAAVRRARRRAAQATRAGNRLADWGLRPGLGADRERELGEALAAARAALADPAAGPEALVAARAALVAARNELVVGNTALVAWVARRYVGCGLPLDDLIGAGNLGLLRAAEKYDVARGTRFATHATWWILQAIGIALDRDVGVVPMPHHGRAQLRRWLRAHNRLMVELGRRPTDAEVAAALGLAPAQAELFARLRVVRRARGVDCALNRADSAEPPDTIAIRAEARAAARAALDLASPRERAVLVRRFGLDGGEPETLRAIGAALGLTKERTRQIEAGALRKLRQGLGEAAGVSLLGNVG